MKPKTAFKFTIHHAVKYMPVGLPPSVQRIPTSHIYLTYAVHSNRNSLSSLKGPDPPISAVSHDRRPSSCRREVLTDTYCGVFRTTQSWSGSSIHSRDWQTDIAPLKGLAVYHPPSDWHSDTGSVITNVLRLLLTVKCALIRPPYTTTMHYNTCYIKARSTPATSQLKADHPLFDWLINCVILNHF